MYEASMHAWVKFGGALGKHRPASPQTNTDLVLLLPSPPGRHELWLRGKLASDPFQPFLGDRKYSITPFVCTLAEVPAHLRWHHGFSTTLALLPGSKDRGSKVGL